MPTSATSFSVSDAPIQRAARFQLLAWIRAGFAPAVSEGREVLKFGESGITFAEFVANPLDARADVCSIAMLAAPRDETDMVHAVVDRAIGDVVSDAGSQKLDDVEFRQREVEINVVPVGSAYSGLQHQPPPLQDLLRLELLGTLARFENESQSLGENWHAARFVDEVEGALVERQVLVCRCRAAREEYDGQHDAPAP